MGANSKQGWYLFLFLVGFTFLPAGLAYLGAIFTLLGAIALVASLIGFMQIKPLEFEADKANLKAVGSGQK
jgi:hypothetical protein